MNSQKLSSDIISNKKTLEEIAAYRNCYKVYAIMNVLMDKGIIKKEEIEEAYLKVANSVLDYFEDEENKRDILRPIL